MPYLSISIENPPPSASHWTGYRHQHVWCFVLVTRFSLIQNKTHIDNICFITNLKLITFQKCLLRGLSVNATGIYAQCLRWV